MLLLLGSVTAGGSPASPVMVAVGAATPRRALGKGSGQRGPHVTGSSRPLPRHARRVTIEHGARGRRAFRVRDSRSFLGRGCGEGPRGGPLQRSHGHPRASAPASVSAAAPSTPAGGAGPGGGPRGPRGPSAAATGHTWWFVGGAVPFPGSVFTGCGTSCSDSGGGDAPCHLQTPSPF